MVEKLGTFARWKNFEPTKKFTFWACVACMALTVFVGFKWGGVVTGGTAREMAQSAAAAARAEIAVAFCMDRFAKSGDRASQLAKLEKTDSWLRGSYVDKAGWVTPPGAAEPVADAGERCAEGILAAAAPAATKVKN